ncbi:hypothetical protein Btru_072847 [Bulinus truncatus]|nr:hypothetical protein Btru_072847 [Bulinus truncatus]
MVKCVSSNPTPEDKCFHNGIEYNPGDLVPLDSCNRCYCIGAYSGHAQFVCTLMACE